MHGLTSSSDMFIMPEHRNLVSFLLDNGFTDVWTLDFRMSNRFPYDAETHRYTLDDIAHCDHPAALRELRRHVGDRRVHVFAHCLGSVSFSMSLFGGAVDGITSLVCNSVVADAAGAGLVAAQARASAPGCSNTSSACPSSTRGSATPRRSPAAG